MTKLSGGITATEIMDPLSETESEPVAEVREAEKIAYLSQGQTTVLCPRGCKDSARPEPVHMLAQDAAISDVRDAPEVDGVKTFRVCPRRAQAYESQAMGRKCARSH